MKLCCSMLIMFSVMSVCLSQPPSYSESYAHVRYQTQWKEQNPINSEVNEETMRKEEVTENSRIVSNAESILMAQNEELTTERESEQVKFAVIQRGRLLKDKLQQNGDSERRENFDTSKPDSVATKLDHLDVTGTELDDLNKQGAYYVIHPTGLFQKVVYTTLDEPRNMQLSTRVQYENIDPIMEAIYTYDPMTFVFQRLVFHLPQ